MPSKPVQSLQDDVSIDFNKLGEVTVKDGLIKWTPIKGIDPSVKKIVSDSVKALNKKIKAGEVAVDEKGRIK